MCMFSKAQFRTAWWNSCHVQDPSSSYDFLETAPMTRKQSWKSKKKAIFDLTIPFFPTYIMMGELNDSIIMLAIFFASYQSAQCQIFAINWLLSQSTGMYRTGCGRTLPVHQVYALHNVQLKLHWIARRIERLNVPLHEVRHVGRFSQVLTLHYQDLLLFIPWYRVWLEISGQLTSVIVVAICLQKVNYAQFKAPNWPQLITCDMWLSHTSRPGGGHVRMSPHLTNLSLLPPWHIWTYNTDNLPIWRWSPNGLTQIEKLLLPRFGVRWQMDLFTKKPHPNSSRMS